MKTKIRNKVVIGLIGMVLTLTAAVILMPKFVRSASASTIGDEVPINEAVQEMAVNTILETEARLASAHSSVASVVENQIAAYEAMLETASDGEYGKIQNLLAALQTAEAGYGEREENDPAGVVPFANPISWTPLTPFKNPIQDAVLAIWAGFVFDGYDLSAELLLFSMANVQYGVNYTPTSQNSQRMVYAAHLREIAGDGSRAVVGDGNFKDHPGWQFIPLPGGLNSIKFDADARYAIGGFTYSKKYYDATQVSMSIKDNYDYDADASYGSGLSDTLLATCRVAQQLGYLTPFYTVINDLIVPGSVPFDHEIRGNEAVITGLGNLSGQSVSIPAMIRKFGYEDSVNDNYMPPLNVRIGDSAFSGNTSLTAVNLADRWVGSNGDVGEAGMTRQIVSIGNSAFSGCTQLSQMSLPSGISRIGRNAFPNGIQVVLQDGWTQIRDKLFQDQTGLSKIIVPASVTSIGPDAFFGCGVDAIEISASNAHYSSATGVLYNKSKTTLLKYPEGKAGSSFAVSGTVTSIGNSAFANCTQLSQLSIPAGVASVSANAFSPNTNVLWDVFNTTNIGTNEVRIDGINGSWPSVAIPQLLNGRTVTGIAANAFRGADIGAIGIPASVRYIDYSAFQDATALTDVQFAADSNLQNIGVAAFDNTGLSTITLPASLQRIEAWAFKGSRALENVYFEYNSNLEYIGENSFRETALQAISIPASVEIIADYAFYGLSSLGHVVFDYNAPQVHHIGKSAFEGTNIYYISIPASVKIIDTSAFRNVTTLRTIEFADNSQLHYIGITAFEHTAIAYLYLPRSLTYIDDYAFVGASISMVYLISDSQLYIGQYAFGWTGIDDIYCETGAVPTVQGNSFDGVNKSDVNVYVRSGTTTQYLQNGWTGFNIYDRL